MNIGKEKGKVGTSLLSHTDSTSAIPPLQLTMSGAAPDPEVGMNSSLAAASTAAVTTYRGKSKLILAVLGSIAIAFICVVVSFAAKKNNNNQMHSLALSRSVSAQNTQSRRNIASFSNDFLPTKNPTTGPTINAAVESVEPTPKTTSSPTLAPVILSTPVPTTPPAQKWFSAWAQLEPTLKPTPSPMITPLISRISALDVEIPSFSADILSGYSRCTTLREDIANALKFTVQKRIEEHAKNECQFYYQSRGGNGETSGTALAAQPEKATSTRNSAGDAAKGENSFKTNNQVDGVEEADPIQSDGSHIFAAYGSDIVVMNLEGEIVARVTVPQPNTETRLLKESTEVKSRTSTMGLFHRKTSTSLLPFARGEIETQVKALLLHEDRLVVIAKKEGYVSPRRSFGGVGNLVSGGTTISFTYKFDANAPQKLTLVHEMKIAGSYKTARAIQANAHIVTNAYINTWGFTHSIHRCANTIFRDLSNDEYEATATQLAVDTVDTYADTLVKDLLGNDDGEDLDENACTHIVRINSMTTGNFTSEEDKHINSNGILNSFAQVTSFDMKQANRAEVQCIQAPCEPLTTEPTVSKAGMFVPTGAVNTYASAEKLVLAARGYRYATNSSSAHPYTYLLGFELNGDVAIAVPTAVGEVKGSLLNSYSMDWWDGHLRVATTSPARGSWVEVTTKNSEGEDVVSSAWEIETESSSQVTILEFNGSEIVQTGVVDNLGVDERIYATRFIGDKAFVVTFRQVDPLYAIDLSDHYNPVVTGELKISGFSNYMKLVQGNYLLTVGQEADESSGQSIGLKIALFDISNMTNPVEAQQPYVEDEGSSSASQYDFHAFRYLEESNRLIIPVSKIRYFWQENDDTEEFDGFKVYSVDANKAIRPIATVTHADVRNINRCYSSARLPSRSMVFNGELVTFKGHSILKSTNLTSPVKVWTKNFDEGRGKTKKPACFNWFLR